MGPLEDSRIRGTSEHAQLPWLLGARGFLQRSSAVLRTADRRSRSRSLGPRVGFSVSTTTRSSTRQPTSSTNHGRPDPGSASTGGMTVDLVAGPVPCAGGNCANGPLGGDTVVDTSIISPDQQFQAGLFCGAVHATPTTPIGSASLGANLCPASQYGSTLIFHSRPRDRG